VLWQRGIALYYAKQYAAAAQQFRDDVALNPNDTEEAIWAFLAEAQLHGPDEARANFLQARTACCSTT
jgi:lipoprotein NlpI